MKERVFTQRPIYVNGISHTKAVNKLREMIHILLMYVKICKYKSLCTLQLAPRPSCHSKKLAS